MNRKKDVWKDTEWQFEKNRSRRVEFEAERRRFEARNNGEHPKVKIAYAAWANALISPPFDSGEFTWQLTVTFPFKIRKDEKMKRFMEEIENVFEKIFFG